MNRQFGITTEHVTASYDNVAYLFDSFTQGKCGEITKKVEWP